MESGETIKQELVQAYNGDAARRDGENLADWKRQEREDFCRLLLQEKRHTFLELGAGPGRDGLYFKEQGIEITCIDLSPENVKLCCEKGLNARIMDFNIMSFLEESFEAVYAMNSLLHTPKSDLPGILKKVKSVLVPSGLFYLGVYGGNDKEGYLDSEWTTPRRFFVSYTDDGIQEAVSKVFDIVYFRRVTLPGMDNHHFQSMVLRKK